MGRLSRLRRGSLHGDHEPLDQAAYRGGATVEFDIAAEPVPDEPDAAGAARSHTPTSYRDRARLRRRLRYLRRARELAFRDLGGFVFDAHRFNRDRDDIIAAKLKGLAGMDAELRSLETALDDRRELMLLHQPGISVCPRCATLHGSDANFCSGCGLPRRGAALPLGPRAPLPIAEAATPPPAQAAPAGPAAWGRPAASAGPASLMAPLAAPATSATPAEAAPPAPPVAQAGPAAPAPVAEQPTRVIRSSAPKPKGRTRFRSRK